MATAMVWVSLAVLLATIGASDAAWCVCRSDVSDPMLQKTIDYACGAGADCMPIMQNGACFQPNTVRSHCSWAANSYYQRRSQMGATCDFSGTATLSNSDPSYSSCSYPASASAAGTGGGTTPSSSFPNATGAGGFTPGILGLSPSGATTLPDGSDGGLLLRPRKDVLFVAAAAAMLSAVLAQGLM